MTDKNEKKVAFMDERAWFCEKVQENSKGMYWLARSILANNEDAKDAVQEAICAAYEKLGTLRDRNSFKPWIMKIVANASYSLIRKRKNQIDIDSVEELAEDAPNDTEESMSLWRAVSGLSDALKTVTVLFYYNDMSINDISRTLSITQGTVKARLSRARDRLRADMEAGEL